jgi:quercetin dioxygenase-like cupin family protein
MTKHAAALHLGSPRRRAAVLAASVLAGAAGLALAAAPEVRKTTLQQQPFPGPPLHTLLVRTEIPKGGVVAPHTHPGVEMAYVAAGEALVSIKGAPDRRLKPGDSFSVPEGVVHSVRDAGDGPLTIVSTYVVDAGKPIASPAPH